MKTGIFIGRFQPFHEGHQACLEKILDTHDHVQVIVRVGSKTKKNPLGYLHRCGVIEDWAEANGYKHQVHVVLLSDPGYDLTVFYGRKVGYKIEELKMPEKVEKISGTNERKKRGL